MIELEKHLTIKEAKNELAKLENELELYLTKKKINFQKTQPKGTNYDKIVVSGTPITFDKFTHYVIKDEELDSKIISLMESVNAYETYIISEIKRMLVQDEIGLISYLKDEGKTWKEIDMILHRGNDYSRTKMKRFEEKRN